MDFNLLLRNRGVRRVLVGVPEGEERVAARIETASGDVITLQEPTLAALARAYLQVTTHPTLRGVELVATAVSERKDGFGEVQLLDGGSPESAVRAELAQRPPAQSLMAAASAPASPSPSGGGMVGGAGPVTFPVSLNNISTSLAEIAASTPAYAGASASPQAMATEHGRPPDDDDDDDDELDLELDEPEEPEERIFGDVPTHHSKPRKKR
ncbi:MAG: hypothetical protein KDA24_08925 [Deltaproteobacteria bacterium]|nr:hypothetical protein [Deltaproteobacteria bacterium]